MPRKQRNPADQLAIIRWELAQLGDRMKAFRRNLVSTETTAEVRARVAEESAQALQLAESLALQK